MKGLSILLTVALLVLAHQLARQLKKSGALPADTHSGTAITNVDFSAGPSQARRLGTSQDL